MKIGDEAYVHGYVDEVRKDAVIIKNEGGYFGTVADEIMPSAQTEPCGDVLDTNVGDMISRQAAIE